MNTELNYMRSKSWHVHLGERPQHLHLHPQAADVIRRAHKQLLCRQVAPARDQPPELPHPPLQAVSPFSSAAASAQRGRRPKQPPPWPGHVHEYYRVGVEEEEEGVDYINKRGRREEKGGHVQNG